MYRVAGTGLFIQTGQVHSRLCINYRKGNDYFLVIFSLAVIVNLPCRLGSWNPAQTLHTALQSRSLGGHVGWRRCKRRCCHLLEPPAVERQLFSSAGSCLGLHKHPQHSAAKTELHKQHEISWGWATLRLALKWQHVTTKLTIISAANISVATLQHQQSLSTVTD